MNNNTQHIIYKTTIQTPIGAMQACATDEGLCLLEFMDRAELPTEIIQLKKHFNAEIKEAENEPLLLLKTELEAYFAGTLKQFATPLKMVGTVFQQSVWNELLNIPFGNTATYTEQTNKLGNEDAIRAVANANGQNKIAIVVPCHRVISKSGKLVGYAGGIERKKWLLIHERNFSAAKSNQLF